MVEFVVKTQRGRRGAFPQRRNYGVALLAASAFAVIAANVICTQLAQAESAKPNILPEIARKTVRYIEQQSSNKPFFVYVLLTSPHIPIVPSKEFRGKSELGSYGDFVIQTDHTVGQILDALDRKGLADHTLLIFTSDNGGAHYVGAAEMEKQGHYTNYIYRGSDPFRSDGANGNWCFALGREVGVRRQTPPHASQTCS